MAIEGSEFLIVKNRLILIVADFAFLIVEDDEYICLLRLVYFDGLPSRLLLSRLVYC